MFFPYKASEIFHYLVAKRLVAKCLVAKCLVAKRPVAKRPVAKRLVAKCPGAQLLLFSTGLFPARRIFQYFFQFSYVITITLSLIPVISIFFSTLSPLPPHPSLSFP